VSDGVSNVYVDYSVIIICQNCHVVIFKLQVTSRNVLTSDYVYITHSPVIVTPCRSQLNTEHYTDYVTSETRETESDDRRTNCDWD